MAIVLATAGGVGDVRLRADDPRVRYYTGLRERGLYRLAESDCLRRLADERIAPGLRADLTIELSQTYAEHAAQRTGEEREELWRRASQAIDTLLDNSPASGYEELLLAQRAFVEAQRGAQWRWQVELLPLDERGREQAVQTLRSALEQLEPLRGALESRQRIALNRPAGNSISPDAPPPSRYRDVRREVEFRLAAATVDLAKVLLPGAERAAALHQADAALRELTNTPRRDQAAWLSEVLLIEVQRLQGNIDRVGPLVTALLNQDPPAPIRSAAVAQWVRADLDDGRPDAALERLQTHSAQGTQSNELSHLVVETLISARRIALEKQQVDLAGELLTEAAARASDLDGPWGVRSRLLIDSARETDTYGPELAQHVRRAKWAWHNGDLDAAISGYEHAVAQAHRSGRTEFAVEFAMTLATLQVEARRDEGAVITLTGLLDNYPEHPRAAEADLLRAYALGRTYQRQPAEDRLQTYRTALEEHRRRFADAPTADEATWMLARLEEHLRRWPQAAELLESIPPHSQRRPAARARLAAVYDEALADRKRRGDPTDEWEQRAITILTTATREFPPLAEPLSPEQREVAWRLARLLLRQSEPDYSTADGLLERVIRSESVPGDGSSRPAAGSSSESSLRLAAASQLRIISLAGQGRLAEARDVIRDLERHSPDRLLEVLAGLTSAADQVAIEHKQTVGTLQLEVVQRLESQRATMTEDQQLWLDESLAQAHAAIGQTPQAAAIYQKLLWQQPNNVRIIEALARLYESTGTLSDIRNASKQWQALERLQPRGSIEWLTTRYHVAWCHHRLGQDEAARKLIGITRILYPELGGGELREQFDQLERSLRPTSAGRR